MDPELVILLTDTVPEKLGLVIEGKADK